MDVLLRRIGWRVQVPARRAAERDEARIAAWREEMGDLVAARDWLTVFQLPPYASELNPVEGIWSVLKRSLTNLAKHDITQLTALVKSRLRRMQCRPDLTASFLAGTKLDLTPF